MQVNIKEEFKKTPVKEGQVSVFKIPKGSDPLNCVYSIKKNCYKNCKHLGQDIKNTITNEVAEFFAGWLAGDKNYNFSHIYGQWGDPGTYPEGSGPFFTPARDDQVTDLDAGSISTVDARVPIIHRIKSTQAGQSEFSENIVSVIGVFTKNVGQVYIGAGLVCELPTNKKLLLSHVALEGIAMGSDHDILILWDWIFSNT